MSTPNNLFSIVESSQKHRKKNPLLLGIMSLLCVSFFVFGGAATASTTCTVVPGKRVILYYRSQASNASNYYNHFDFSKVTDLIFSKILPNAGNKSLYSYKIRSKDRNCKVTSRTVFHPDTFKSFIKKAKEANPCLRIHVSIGSAKSDKFGGIAVKANAFANSLLSFYDKFKVSAKINGQTKDVFIDGFHFDWEGELSSTQQDQYKKLLETTKIKFKRQRKKDIIVSIAAPGRMEYLKYHKDDLHKAFDFAVVMTYGGIDPKVRNRLSLHYSKTVMKAYTDKGWPISKLALGSQTFAQEQGSFTTTNCETGKKVTKAYQTVSYWHILKEGKVKTERDAIFNAELASTKKAYSRKKVGNRTFLYHAKNSVIERVKYICGEKGYGVAVFRAAHDTFGSGKHSKWASYNLQKEYYSAINQHCK